MSRGVDGLCWAKPKTQLSQGGKPHAAPDSQGLGDFAYGNEAFPRSPRLGFEIIPAHGWLGG